MRRLLPAALVALASVPAAAASQDTRSDSTSLDSIFAFATTKTPGCAVATIRNGVLDIARGYGMADLEHDVPITPRTPFYLASVSKQFTAGAVNLLVTEGKLSLDDDVRKFVPELPKYEASITVRHLVNHTSGLRDYLTLFNVAGIGDLHITNADFLEMLRRQRGLNFRPGELYSYSNSNYVLLGIIVERVTGKSLRAFAQERIFEPLGMSSTVFRDRQDMLIKGRALAYYSSGGAQYHGVPHFDVVGDGGLFSTVEDLARWERHLIEPRFGAVWVKLSDSRGRLTDGTELTYGSGLIHGTYRGETTVEHGGGFGGYSTYLLRFPKLRLSVAVLCNGGSNAGPLAQRVANLYLPADAPAATQAVATPTATQITPAELSSRTGRFFNDQRVLFREIVVADGKLYYSRGPNDRSELVPLGGARYQMAGQPLTVTFVGRDTIRIDAVPGSPATVLRRVTPGKRDLREYAGTYASSDLASRWLVQVTDTALTISRPRGETVRVARLFDDAFRSPAVIVRFKRDAKGEIGAMEVSAGERARHIRFERVPNG